MYNELYVQKTLSFNFAKWSLTSDLGYLKGKKKENLLSF